MPKRPIGIFDSGLGGLTVFSEISKLLPSEDLVYLGDTARVPYGTKSAETVTRYAEENVQFLLKKNVKMVVIACNTASAYALDELRKSINIPIIGVIEPGANGALRASRSKRIGVLATEGTIRSEAYLRAIQDREPTAEIIGTPCPLFVPLVEEGWWEGEIPEKVADRYLEPLLKKKIDTLILGCTHYPLLKKTLTKVCGPKITLIDSAEETAQEVFQILQEGKIIREKGINGQHLFYVTDAPERFARLGKNFIGEPLKDVEKIRLG